MKALKVDGICGQQTKKRTQKWLGVKQDGKFLTKSIKKLQKRVGAKADGKFGRQTATCFQQYLNAHGETLAVDGVWGKASKMGLQRFLNRYYHLDPQPAPPSTAAQRLADMAIKCAWKKGTPRSKFTYPGGSATSAFREALEKAYPNRSKWGKQTRAGASCDVGSGTCIRAAGIDKGFPRGLSDQIPYIKKSKNFTRVDVTSASSLKAGDVIIYTKKKGGGHICIYRGDGLVCEAGYQTKRFFCTVSLIKSRFNPTYIKNTYGFFGVYRPKG